MIFIFSMLRLARVIALDERAQMHAILNGLRSHIAGYVTQKAPENIQQLTEHARIAEPTNFGINEGGCADTAE